jgi:uncharacterized protein YutE (UPF0331/DUF86 family)
MVDKDILWSKISSLQKHVDRIKAKREVELQQFLQDLDRQESVLFNLQMAVQNCIDLAAHIVAEEGLGVAGSTNELFYLLEEQGYIGQELTEKMIRAVGFRNLIVHEYGKLDLEVVFRVSHEDVEDLERFCRELGELFG